MLQNTNPKLIFSLLGNDVKYQYLITFFSTEEHTIKGLTLSRGVTALRVPSFQGNSFQNLI